MIKKVYSLGAAMLLSLMLSCSSETNEGQTAEVEPIEGVIEVDVNETLHAIQPTMFGIFFEDINFAADGGLYAELVKNRSFEFYHPWMGWEHLPDAETRFNLTNELTIVDNEKINAQNPHFARVDKRDDAADFGLQNVGFDGMGVKEGAQYDFSIWARLNSGNMPLKVEIIDTTGTVLGSTDITPASQNWQQYEAVITSNTTTPSAKLRLTFPGQGQLDFDNVSLFPQDTWKGRKGGLRKDLVQLLDDLNPGFLRFPGGCIVEGRTLDQRYQWKKTVGPTENREFLINRWNEEFAHRPAPDYFQSFGLGFFEYFQLSEDLGAEPLPILSCGLACQFNTSETVEMDELDPYIDDALDLIEFANGSVTSKWGKIRASMGHPEPFNLKYIGVGNEQWGEEYFERYEAFSKAIKAKYPDMNIISGTGPYAEGDMFEAAEKALVDLKPEIVDEHYYKPPQWFRENATRYDSYDRERYKIFAGEYAAQSVAIASPDNRNSWDCALSEAAYITGLERNADVVYMTSYAPLFAHVNRWQWTPDLIWFDNLTSYGTANYYVQKLFSTNVGTHTLPIKRNGENVTGQGGLYAAASKDAETGDIIVKVVNVLSGSQPLNINLNGLNGDATAKMISLENSNLELFNTIETPDAISPSESEIEVVDGAISMEIPGSSFKVFRISDAR